jgi:hypothetical protein
MRYRDVSKIKPPAFINMSFGGTDCLLYPEDGESSSETTALYCVTYQNTVLMNMHLYLLSAGLPDAPKNHHHTWKDRKQILHQVNSCAVGFEVLTPVVMKSSIFWDITLRSAVKVGWRFGGKCGLLFFTLVYLAYSPTLKMEATCSSETSVDFQRTTRRYIPEFFETTCGKYGKVHALN